MNNPTAGAQMNSPWRVRISIWLLGSIALTFGQGHFPSPLLLLIGIACWIWACRRVGALLTVLLVSAGNIIVWEIAYRGMVPLPLAARLGMELGVSILLSLVFVLDQRLYRCDAIGAWSQTLVVPVGWVAFELLNARVSPGATWSSIAYSLVDEVGLLQLAAVLGWTGLTFLLCWLAALSNLAIDSRKAWPLVTGVATVCLIAATGFGSLPPIARDDDEGTRVALLVTPDTYHIGEHLDEVWMYTRGVSHSDEQRELAVRQIEASLQENLRMVEREAELGAELIVWAEANVSISDAEEQRWIEAFGRIAARHQTHIAMGLVVFRPNQQPPSENKMILIGPSGQLLHDFLKRSRPPGASHAIGEGGLPAIPTAFAKLSAAICFDMDFPQLVATAPNDTDALIVPANDWLEAGPTHSRMARMRGVENGVWVLRPTKDGVSSVSDPAGRLLASQVTIGRRSAVLRCAAPLHGRWTLYSIIGDLFAWLCVVAWVVLAVVSLRGNKSSASDPA